jgi:ubiquinone/menaquinone biosynthesis C-methylase UbiE
LPFNTHSKDVAIIQGGLHHLETIPDDLHRCLKEIHRMLRPDGQVFIVEPWHTPFLSIVHAICKVRCIRMLVPKIDALATMIEQEHVTYCQWLNKPRAILTAFEAYFVCTRIKRRWGKVIFVGNPR